MTEPGPTQGPSTTTADHTAYASNHSLVQRETRHLPSWFVIVMSMVAGLSLVLGIIGQVQYQSTQAAKAAEQAARADEIYRSNLDSCERGNDLRKALSNYLDSIVIPSTLDQARLKPFNELKAAVVPVDCKAVVKGGS